MILKSVHLNEEITKVSLFFNQVHGQSSKFLSFFNKNTHRDFNRDVDSDGDEIPSLEPEDPTDYQYSLWFTVDISVQAPDPQTTVDLTSPCLVCSKNKGFSLSVNVRFH